LELSTGHYNLVNCVQVLLSNSTCTATLWAARGARRISCRTVPPTGRSAPRPASGRPCSSSTQTPRGCSTRRTPRSVYAPPCRTARTRCPSGGSSAALSTRGRGLSAPPDRILRRLSAAVAVRIPRHGASPTWCTPSGRQGLPLVHFSAQPEPCCLLPKPTNISQKVLILS